MSPVELALWIGLTLIVLGPYLSLEAVTPSIKILGHALSGVAVVLIAVSSCKILGTSASGPPIHVTRGASMVVTAKGRGSLQVLYDKTFTTPIDLFIWFQVDNTQSSTPATVSAYTLEAAPSLDGPWTELCPVPLDKSVLLMETPTPNIAWTTDLRGSMLEKTLLNQSLPPHAVVSGWTAWICPHPDCIGGGDVFRLKTFDASGVTITSIAEPLVGHLITTGSQLQINGSVNTARFVSQPWDCH